MSEEDENEVQEEESSMSKLSLPESLSKYFGKYQYPLKFLQLNSKLKMGHKDTIMGIKMKKNKKNTPILENTTAKFELKDKKNKLSFSFNPFFQLKNQYEAVFKIYYDKCRVEFNYDHKNQGKIKYVQNLDLYENYLKATGEYVGKIKKGNVSDEYGLSLDLRLPQYQIPMFNHIMKQDRIAKLKIGSSQKFQLQGQVITNFQKAQNKKEETTNTDEEKDQNNKPEFKKKDNKNNTLYKVNFDYKLIKKNEGKWQNKLVLGLEESNFNQNFNSQVTYEGNKISSWTLRYLNKYFPKTKIGFSLSSKGWEAILHRNLYKKKFNLSVGNKQLGLRFDGSLNQHLKYEISLQKKYQNNWAYGLYLSINY